MMSTFGCREGSNTSQASEPTPQPIPKRTLNVVEAIQLCGRLLKTGDTFEVEGTYAAIITYYTNKLTPSLRKNGGITAKNQRHLQVILEQHIDDEGTKGMVAKKFRVDVVKEPDGGFKIGNPIAMKGTARYVDNVQEGITSGARVCGMSGSPSQ